MGIDNSTILVEPESKNVVYPPAVENDDPDRVAFEDEQREAAYADRNSRADIEATFAGEREKIEEKFIAAVARATKSRDNAHAKNHDKRLNVYAKTGLNPNGSDPRGREQTIL